MNTTKNFIKAIKVASEKTTRPYDTQAEVVRVEGDTLWVHIPGGIDETPVQRTIAASPGDHVQVRVANGTAWVVGNASAPPTDDQAAQIADNKAVAAHIAAREAEEKAVIAFGTAEEAVKGVKSIREYFWFTSEGNDPGAHITQIPQEDFIARPSQGNVRMTSQGLEVREGREVLASFGEDVKIGRDGYFHLNEKGIEGRNRLSVKYFDINMAGGSHEERIYHYFGDPSVKYTSWNDSDDVYKAIDLNDVSSGNVRINEPSVTVFNILTNAKDLNDVQASGTNLKFLKEIDTLTGYVRVRCDQVSSLEYNITTKELVKLEAVLQVRSNGVNATNKFTIFFSDAGEFMQVTTYVTYSKTTKRFINFSYYYHCSFLAETTTPFFTLGRRQTEEGAGEFSTAIGEGLVASGKHQTVIGRYNDLREDTKDKYAFIIGNGNYGVAYEPNNALTVDWDGNLSVNNVYDHLDRPVAWLRDIEYSPGETVTLSALVGSGYSTGTTGTYYLFLETPKTVPRGKALSVTSITATIRGGNGLAVNNQDVTSNLSNMIRGTNGRPRILLTGLTNNFKAQSPAHVVLDITFTIAS